MPVIKDKRSVEERRFSRVVRRVEAAFKRGEERGYEGRVFPLDDTAADRAKKFAKRLEGVNFSQDVHVGMHDWGQHGWNVAVWWKPEVA